VAGHVKKTPYSLGYVELDYAHRLDLATGLVRNREKEFVKATLDSITAAAADLSEVPDDLRFSLTDPPGKEAYPICGATWAVVRVNQPAARRKALVDFLSWLTHDGQPVARSLFYADLPEALVGRAEKKIDRIKAGK
jgi:phosphate transport system substrate-binding protein